MAFCMQCGAQIPEDAKFCPKCGKSVCAYNINERRVNDYAGKIIKCPNCGNIVESFQSTCSACGHEIREADVTISVKEFSRKLEDPLTIDQKITLIRNYPIPNSKEDIFEFMILAMSGISAEYNEDLFNAWKAKFEQCYLKAKIAFLNKEDLEIIQNMYKNFLTTTNIEKKRYKLRKLKKFIPNPVFAFALFMMIIYNILVILRGMFCPLTIIFTTVILGSTYTLGQNKRKHRKTIDLDKKRISK